MSTNDFSDASRSLKLTVQAAQQGDASAQFNLGVMYANGDGVELDKAKAVSYLTLAAQQGHPHAAATAARLSG